MIEYVLYVCGLILIVLYERKKRKQIIKELLAVTDALADSLKMHKMHRDNLIALQQYFELFKKQSNERGSLELTQDAWRMLEQKRVGKPLAMFGDIPNKIQGLINKVNHKYKKGE